MVLLPHYSVAADYANPYLHMLMSQDRIRQRMYETAIGAAIKGGELVADLGSGMGMWGRYAAECGAKKVYMIEREPRIARFASALNEQFGFSETVETIVADCRDVVLPGAVDVVISEFIGGLLFDEGLVTKLQGFSLRNCHASTIYLPAAYELLAAPAILARKEASLYEPERRLEAYGDLGSAMAYFGLVNSREKQYLLETDGGNLELLGPGRQVWAGIGDLKEKEESFTATLELPEQEALGGRLVVAAWFHARFPNGMDLSNRPGREATHWGTAIIAPRGKPPRKCRRVRISYGRGVDLDLSFA